MENFEKLVKLEGFEPEKGYIYFIDGDGDFARVAKAESKADKGKKPHEKLAKLNIKREYGYLYFVKGFPDGHYVCRREMSWKKK